MILFEGMSEEEKKRIMRHLKKVKFKAGEVIIREGETDRSMYIFESGKVKITRHLTLKLGGKWGEAEKAIDILSADKVGFFGEMSLLTGAPRSATIVAVTDCVLYKMEPEDLEEIATRYPGVAYKFVRNIAKVLSNRVRRLNDVVLKLTTVLSIMAHRG